MFYQSFITLTPDSLHGCRDGVIKRDLIKTEQAFRITAPHSWIWETIGQGLLLCLTSSRSSFRWWRTQMLRRRGCRGVVCYFQFTLDEMSQQFGGNYSTFYYMMHSCSPLTEEWCVCVGGRSSISGVLSVSRQHLRVVLKLLSGDARKVAGSAAYEQSQTEWNCVVL